MTISVILLMAGLGRWADAQPATDNPLAESATWTLIAPPDGSFKVLIPCSQDEIAATLKADKVRALRSVGCKKSEYSAVAVSMPGAPPHFFESQLRSTKKTRIAPDRLNGHRVVRWRDVLKSGPGESTGQLVEIRRSNYLLMTVEQRTPVTDATREFAERFLNSVEVSGK
jgi:hypothetical protein